MALTVDWDAKVVYSDASITDLPVHHIALRDLEASEAGMLYDDICDWQSLDQGGGATLPQIDYINGYRLMFPIAGNYSITGNLNAPIIPAAGVYVERTRATAYTTTAQGGSGPTKEEIAAQVRAELSAELAQLTKVAKLHGIGAPLVVSPTSRTAGSVSQTITTAGDVVTVTET